MAASTLSLQRASVLLLLLLHLFSGFTVGSQKTWCVAKPSADEVALAENLHYACSAAAAAADCGSFARHGPCFLPDSLISHASVAMNLYYQAKGRNPWDCYFNATGLVVLTDPSYGKCKYA